MKFSEYLESNLRLWPETIDISDGELLPGDGGLFPNLSSIWEGVERKTEAEGEIESLMTWAVFCGLHERAIELRKKKVLVLDKRTIDLAVVREMFNESFYLPENEYQTFHEHWIDDLP